MNQEVHHAKSIQEIFNKFETSENGLSDEEAKRRLEKYGKNELKKIKRLRPVKIFFEQFKSFLIYILIVAAIISFLIKHSLDGFVISAIVVLNASLGFFQQYKAEKSIISLRKIIIPKSKVIRGGVMKEIPSSEIVLGDLIILSGGDKINADCRVIDFENLQTNEAVLTGESFPVNKFSQKISEKTILNERKNMVFTGTQIVRGSGKAIVVSTGMNTEFGKIAEHIQEIEPQKTPMQKRLDKFSKQIGLIILAAVSLIVIWGLLQKFDGVNLFLTAVSLAVSAIPEGLPAVLAISFAISSLAMSKKNVIIKRLPAVESLGSVTVICSDKTGTITEERMFVQEIFANNNFYDKKDKDLFLKNKKINAQGHKEIFQLIKTSVLCNNARFEKIEDKYEIIGDPTEESLISNSLDLGFDKKIMTEKEPSIQRFEFDSKRKMMSIVRDIGRNKVIYSKGAIEKILEISSSELVNGQIKNLNDYRKKQILEMSRKMEEKALRVLAFSYKNIFSKTKPEEKGMIFLGFVGMIDPPRPEVKQAIKECKSAGIKIKMITGDSALTATAIANQIGINGKTITENELIHLSDEELKLQINEIGIFARTSPEQKLRITKILQELGEIVAITGDGINDSLALKSADIGIAMGKRGTDVSRDVSDIVLADDNFSSIVHGVKEGRKTYDNVKKFTKYFLAVNFSQIILILSALILKLPLPLLPLQILWINLVTDSLPALSLVFEREENVMKTSPRKEKSLLKGIWGFIILGGILAFLAEFVIYLIGINQGTSVEKIRTIVLTTAILFELLFVYTCRSVKPLKKIGIFSNKKLNYAILISIGLHLILLYTPLANLFSVVPLTIRDWLLIIPFAISGLLFFELGKSILRYRKHSS